MMFNLRESREVVQEPSSFEARTRPCIPRNRRNMDRIDWLYRWTGSWPVGEKTNPDSGKLEQREEPPATPKQAVSLTDELRIHQESRSRAKPGANRYSGLLIPSRWDTLSRKGPCASSLGVLSTVLATRSWTQWSEFSLSAVLAR
jgi:hypothetical protein